MNKQLAVLLLAFIAFSCTHRVHDPMQITVYKTEPTKYVLNVLWVCDSIAHTLADTGKVDTTNLSIHDKLSLDDKIHRAKHPILNAIDYYHSESSGYIFNYHSIFGTALLTDTAQLNSLFNLPQCKPLIKGFTLKWIPMPDDSTHSYLIAFKSLSPALTFNPNEIDSFKITPVNGLLQLISVFTKDSAGLSDDNKAYYLNIKLKRDAAQHLKNLIAPDTNSGYIVLVKSHFLNEIQVLPPHLMRESSTLPKIHYVEKKDMRAFIEHLDCDIPVKIEEH